MEKICKKCNKKLEISNFYKQQQKGKNGQIWPYYDCYCRKCRTTYSGTRRRNVKEQAIKYKGGKCIDCGLIDSPCVYDFHHLNPNLKEIALGSMGGMSFNKIKSELDKCVLLCANCHRKRHSNSDFWINIY